MAALEGTKVNCFGLHFTSEEIDAQSEEGICLRDAD
jgi:hypothetical protein